jgi:predicted exporter
LNRPYVRLLALAWALVVCVLLAHNGYLLLQKRIVPDTDILALLPVQQRDPVLQRSFTQMVEASQQRVIVLVGAPDWDDAKRAADAYGAVLAHTNLVQPDRLSGTNQDDLLAPFQQHKLTLLTGEQEQQLATQAAQFWLDSALRKLYGAFDGPRLGAFRDDPFGLFTGWALERAQESPVRPRDGRLFVADAERQYVLLVLNLTQPAFSMAAQETVLPLLAQAKDAAASAAPGVQVIQAGVILHAGAASSQASGEMSTIGVGSLVGIVLLIWLTFHTLRPIGLILLSIVVGFLGSLSVCLLLFERIHLITLVFGASLIGVAQDYGIYFLCNRLGCDPKLSSSALLKRLLPGLCLTLMAAVIGYLGLALTPFPGLRQMAVFSALGLIFAWLTVVCWFPLLVGPGTLQEGKLAQRYGAALAYWPRLQKNRSTLAALLVFIVIAGFGIARLGVNDDIRLLQTPSKQLVSDQIQLSTLLDAPTPVQFYLVRGATSEIVLQREEALKKRLDPLVAAGRISGYQALSNWVPSNKTQRERTALIESRLLFDGGPLTQLAKAIDEDDVWVAATRDHLRASGALLTPQQFLAAPASAPWRHLWLGQVSDDNSNPDGNAGNGTPVHASIVALRGLGHAGLPLLAHAADGLDGVQWVDKVAEISSVLGQYRQMMGAVVLGAYLMVYALLYRRYRAKTWRVLAPGIMASIATLALLGLAGQDLQLFHLLALMLLLGIGVDYGIFMQERAPADASQARAQAMQWLAVGLSAASTILSFGLLGLSQTPALHAFGSTMFIGTALVWLIVPCFSTKKENCHVQAGPN